MISEIDRVNYAVTEARLEMDQEKKVIILHLQIDEENCSIYEYFDIFLGRMQMCRHAGEFFGVRFKLLAKRLKHVVYLDKGTLITLSKHIFAVASRLTAAAISLNNTSGIRNMEYILSLKDKLSEKSANLPSNLDDPKIKDDLLIIKNDNRQELETSMKEVLDILEDNV